MSDNYTANLGSGGKDFASDEIAAINYPRLKLVHGADGVNDGDISTVNPLPSRDYEESPQVSTTSDSAIAAGASATLDSAQIGSSKTGRLIEVVCAATVPIKVELQTVLNAVATTKIVNVAVDGRWHWRSPGRNYISQAQDAGVGFDGFRVVVTNLDTSRAADLYATFLYDEES